MIGKLALAFASLFAVWLFLPHLHAAADDVEIGAAGVIANTGSTGVRVRSGPGTQYPEVTTLPDGVAVVVAEGPVTDQGGRTWYRIASGGQSGWVAGAYLAPVAERPAHGATAVPAGLAGPRTVPAAPPPLSAALPPSTTSGPAVAFPIQGSAAVAAVPPGTLGQTQGAAARPTGARVISVALGLVGTPYVWGGRGPAGFDCSGFVLYVYQQFGIQLPPSTFDQWTVGRTVPRGDLLVGDVVFFADTYGPGITHNGIYVGDNAFVHAENESTGVVRSSLATGYWAGKYAGARRVLD